MEAMRKVMTAMKNDEASTLDFRMMEMSICEYHKSLETDGVECAKECGTCKMEQLRARDDFTT